MNNLFKILFLLFFVIGIIKNSCAFIKDDESFKNQQKSSLAFQENKGQVHDQNYNPRTDILYSGKNGNMAFFLKNSGMHYQLYKVDEWKQEKLGIDDTSTTTIPSKITLQRIDISWKGCNPNSKIISKKQITGFDNFYLPSCPNGALFVKSYEEITYVNIYEGIDLIFHNKDDILHYDFKVKPGIDYRQIKIKIEGADKIAITKKGDIKISTPLGDIIEGKPLVFQEGKQLRANWVLKDNQLSFNIEDVNPSLEILIDPPVRNWGTYYGGNDNEGENSGSCTTDYLGNVFLAGRTSSTNNIATSGTHQTVISFDGGILVQDGYVAKFNANGNRLWGTYYGGTSSETVYSCSADAFGNIYITGSTSSDSVIATPGAYQSSRNGSNDAFLAKFGSNGQIIFGTYFGGSGAEDAFGSAVDKFGNVYISGSTNSYFNLSTTGAHQSNIGGSSDGFLAKFDSLGNLLWATYYGGTSTDNVRGCSVDWS